MTSINTVRSQLLQSGYSLDQMHKYVNKFGQSNTHVTRDAMAQEFSKVSSGGFTRAEVTNVLNGFGFVVRRDLNGGLFGALLDSVGAGRITDREYKTILGPNSGSFIVSR